ncbi:ATP synthase complex subunit H-domain-containing protein [Fomitopsis serialis]|uniref:ATP synthase complex subunit H-domain-containing protein n=1 Tax=Fomitopsis serialis TaxID=139415 RepID=UPI0020075E73|nr:ATP synthase complex subunit H-domain-containing protein [Neoantrodia serialis]KAH9919040.1 ATP synthase complex subunit H-domain-containing protein [Neoantrodia serialis]
MSSTVLRQASSAARAFSRQAAFSTSAAARKDFVQELYIKELKSYKAPPPAKDAHVGVVKQYSMPPTPKPPVVPADLASELTAYDATEPVEGAPKAAAAGAPEQLTTGADTFLTFLEADEPKAEGHH